MPAYTYKCNSCNKKFEIVCSIRLYKEHEECEFCKSKDTHRSYSDDMMSLSTSIKKSDSELRTLGDLAKRNSDRMSEDEKASLHKKHNYYKDNKPDAPLPKGMSRVKKPPKTKWT